MLENEYVFVCRFLAHPSLYTWDSKLDMSRPKLQQFYSALWTQMTYVCKRVATDGARTNNSLYERKENWVATGGAHRNQNHAVIWNEKGGHWRCPNIRKLCRHRRCPKNDAMKLNGTKGSPLAAPELPQKSVKPCQKSVCYMYISDWLQLQCSFIQPMFHMAVSIEITSKPPTIVFIFHSSIFQLWHKIRVPATFWPAACHILQHM